MIVKKMLFALVILILAGCYKVEYSGLTYYNESNNSKSLRIDGYFISNSEFDSSYKHYLILYQDGTFYDLGLRDDSFDSIKKYSWERNYDKNTIGPWGCYIIKDDTLKVQRFSGSRKFPYTAYWIVRSTYYTIENDTLISIEGYIQTDTSKIDIRKRYTFNGCVECKPDSFNFIKKHFAK